MGLIWEAILGAIAERIPLTTPKTTRSMPRDAIQLGTLWLVSHLTGGHNAEQIMIARIVGRSPTQMNWQSL